MWKTVGGHDLFTKEVVKFQFVVKIVCNEER